jgi:hypothetical protein
MTEHENAEQIGRLAEEYSHTRGKLNHVSEKLNHFYISCQAIGNQQVFQILRVENGKLLFNSPPGYPPNQVKNLEGLLNHSQLIEVIEEKQRLANELESLAERLRALAPHLL